MQKVKKKLKKTFSSFTDILNDNGEYSLRKSLVLIFCLSCWVFIFQICAQGFNVLQLYGPVMIFNLLPIMLVMYFLYFVIGKISVSYIITNAVMAILLLVNHFKIKFRDEPLTASDFTLGKEAGNIVSNYELSLNFSVIFILVFCGVSFWFIGKHVRNKRPGIITSAVGIILTLAVAFTANSIVYKREALYDSLLSRIGIYRDSTMVSGKGLVYSLLNDVHKTKYEPPAGYSIEVTNGIMDNYQYPQMPENTPNVIAVMCEAYTDIQDWDNVVFTDENPYEYFNYLKSKGCYGEIFVAGFGGATAITEFEFLTGNNTSSISSSMPTAYKSIITGDTYSIVRIFKDLGYSASAIHPGYPWFYNRQNVYPRMGFDRFASRDNLGDDIPSIGNYVTDSVTANMIIEDCNAHLRENPDKGYFNFTVTIQNHGQYKNDELVYGKEYIAKDTVGLTDEEYHIINNYLGGIKDADLFMKTIYEYINTLDVPTVFIIFGDHLPYLDTEEIIYEKLGLDIKSDTYEAFENRYSTDYLIVGNDAYIKNNTPSINGHQKTLISSNYLSIKLFQYMNMPLTPFHAFSYDMMQYAPILSNKHNGTSAGFDEVLPEEFNKMFEEFKMLQYYNLKEYEAKSDE